MPATLLLLLLAESLPPSHAWYVSSFSSLFFPFKQFRAIFYRETNRGVRTEVDASKQLGREMGVREGGRERERETQRDPQVGKDRQKGRPINSGTWEIYMIERRRQEDWTGTLALRLDASSLPVDFPGDIILLLRSSFLPLFVFSFYSSPPGLVALSTFPVPLEKRELAAKEQKKKKTETEKSRGRGPQFQAFARRLLKEEEAKEEKQKV